LIYRIVKLILITVAAYQVGVNGIQSMTSTSLGDSDSDFTGDNYVALGRNIVTPESLSQFSRSEYMSKE